MDKKKCQVTDGKLVEPCDTLREAAEFGNPRGKQKGVWCWEYYRPQQAGPTRRFFGIKSGEFVAKGMAFNWCPFCGEKIDAPLETPNA